MADKINVIQIHYKDKKRWNSLLQESLTPSYRQTMEYAESKEINNRATATFIFQRNNEDIAGVHYSTKSLFFSKLKTCDIQSGVIWKESPDEISLSYIVNHFIDWAQKNKAAFISFSPWLPLKIDGETTNFEKIYNKILNEKKFTIAKKGRHTYWLDLKLTEDLLLKKMRRKTRYDVKQGIKSNIVITEVTAPDNTIIHRFWELYSKLGKQKNFNILKEGIFKHNVNFFLKSGLASLFVAKFGERIINISLASKIGIASYMYGAINPDFKKLEGCPPPGHVAQWEMIKTMKRIGLKNYDMGFCPGPIPNPEHPAYQIWRFKYGFGGMHVEFLPTYVKVLKPISGRVIRYLKYKQL
ncbi:MAG: lipid II:glycine glycyltransferase FemX [bacterium]